MKRGFTLVEILVVLSILVLTFAVIIPSFRSSYESLQVTSLLRHLESGVRYAQSRAVFEGARYLFRYEREERAWRFLREKREGDKLEWTPVREKWGKPRKIPDPLSFAFRGKDRVLFLPDGKVTQTEISLRSGSHRLARISLGRSLSGVEIERKGL